MSITDTIRHKRQGGTLSEKQLRALMEGYVDGRVPDYQMSAWLMAVFFRGMTAEETQTWARLMWKSGITLPREPRHGYWVDKHSTGGVGDKTSLLLVPIVKVAAQKLWGEGRVYIPMVSGRGLDFSGGTLDKLESVPGFRSGLEIPKALELLERQGFFMMGQTADLAPADRLIYALRDVTGTVECLPLIVSSILSKKFAENLDGLVLDVKFGDGAFMPDADQARKLAQALLDTAWREGVRASAVLSSMDEPLGYAVGNLVEVEECTDYLAGTRREAGLHQLTLALAAEMLRLAAPKPLDTAEALAACEAALATQEPLQVFRQLFEAQGGDWGAFEQRRLEQQSLVRFPVCAEQSGVLNQVSARGMGKLIRDLGGGRQSKESVIDPRVGAWVHAKVGDKVEAGDVLFEVLTPRPMTSDFQNAARAICRVQSEQVPATRWVEEVLYDG
ncbi:thymidine phosphorylase [bacterium]|nr:thymidine phosphorylase [bacterium]